MNIQFDNPIPASLEAERSLLGAILMDPSHFESICGRLNSKSFFHTPHRFIFEAMSSLHRKEFAVELPMLRQELKETQKLEAAGGTGYLMALTEKMPRRPSLESYIDILCEKETLRAVAEMAQSALSMTVEEGKPSQEVISALQGNLSEILDGDGKYDDPAIQEWIVEAMDRWEERNQELEGIGLSFGHKKLDQFTGGMRPGEVAVIGARSGVGKSTLMCQSLAENCRAGIPSHAFSLEMTRAQILYRLIALESKVPYLHIDRPWLANNYDKAKIRDYSQIIAEWPLYIHDRGDMHIDQIVGLARISIRKNGVRLICVDYAQNARSEGKDERTKVSYVSSSLTRMIKHEPAALMLFSQLRKVDREHYSKPPVMADLRETGQLENDAHVGILLHRGWDEAESKISDDAEIIVAKQRRGETGAIQSKFNRFIVAFE